MEAGSTPKIYLHLHDRETDIVHRAGMLGLWMTLNRLERQFPAASSRPGGLDWELTPLSVSIDWEGEDASVLDWLLHQAFRVDDRGLIWLTGLDPPSVPLERRIFRHRVLKATLWQYNGTVTADKSQLNKTQRYQPIASCAHQNFSSISCDRRSRKLKANPIPISSWLYPGAALKHSGLGKRSACKETIERALALLFLPVACQYYFLARGNKEQYRHPKYLLLVPEPGNLEAAARIRWHSNDINYLDLYVSSAAQAALNFYLRAPRSAVSAYKCQTIVYSKLSPHSWLTSPSDIQEFSIDRRSLDLFATAARKMPPNRLSSGLVCLNLVKGIVAENLLARKPPWHDLSAVLKDKDPYREIQGQLPNNAAGLFAMLKLDPQIASAQSIFIDIVHEALKRIYARFYEDNRETAAKKVERENDRFRSDLLACYGEDAFRHLMSRFLAKAGNVNLAPPHRQLVLPLICGQVNWQEARDIALIALSSYPTRARSDRQEILFLAFALLVEERCYRRALLLL